MIKKMLVALLAISMVLPVNVAAAGFTRVELDPSYSPWSLNGSTKDSCEGTTSKDGVSCVGELIYYGYTGYKTTTETSEACHTLTATVYAENIGVWYEIDTDTQNGVDSVYAAGQYGDGTEASQGYHYVKDYSGGTWSGHTCFSYDTDECEHGY